MIQRTGRSVLSHCGASGLRVGESLGCIEPDTSPQSSFRFPRRAGRACRPALLLNRFQNGNSSRARELLVCVRSTKSADSVWVFHRPQNGPMIQRATAEPQQKFYGFAGVHRSRGGVSEQKSPGLLTTPPLRECPSKPLRSPFEACEAKAGLRPCESSLVITARTRNAMQRHATPGNTNPADYSGGVMDGPTPWNHGAVHSAELRCVQAASGSRRLRSVSFAKLAAWIGIFTSLSARAFNATLTRGGNRLGSSPR